MMPARTVSIRKVSVVDWNPPVLTVDVACGKGTYIRSLARDIGEACGSCAYLRSLVRTEVGPFSLDEAVAHGEFQPEKDVVHGSAPFRRLGDQGVLVVQDRFIGRMRLGGKIEGGFFLKEPTGKGPFIVFSQQDELVAFIDGCEGAFRYRFVAA